MTNRLTEERLATLLDMISCAPRDDELKDEIENGFESLREENEKLNERHTEMLEAMKYLRDEMADLHSMIDGLKAENEKLKAILASF